MKKKQKLSIESIKVKSFITTLDAKQHERINGGKSRITDFECYTENYECASEREEGCDEV